MTNHRYFSAIVERENNRSGRTEFVVYFRHSAEPRDNRPTWFDFPAGQTWFQDANEQKFFCFCIGNRKNIASRFVALDDAVAFLKQFEPAELKSGVYGPTPFDEERAGQDAR